MPLQISTLDRFLLRMLLLSQEIKIFDNALASFIQIKAPIADAFGYPVCITFGLLAIGTERMSRSRLFGFDFDRVGPFGTGQNKITSPGSMRIFYKYCESTSLWNWIGNHRTYRSNNFWGTLCFCISACLVKWASNFEGQVGSQSQTLWTVAYCSGKICFFNSKSSLEIKNASNEFWNPRFIHGTDLIFLVRHSRRLPPTQCHLRVIPTYPFPSTRTSNFRSNTCCCRDRALHHHPLYIILWEGWFNAWERGGGTAVQAGRRIKRTVLASSQRISERRAALSRANMLIPRYASCNNSSCPVRRPSLSKFLPAWPRFRQLVDPLLFFLEYRPHCSRARPLERMPLRFALLDPMNERCETNWVCCEDDGQDRNNNSCPPLSTSEVHIQWAALAHI